MEEKIYQFVGYAYGRFKTEQGRMQDYYNMYVNSPVSDFASEDYHASGYKAEKLRCTGIAVWNGLKPGDQIHVLFDQYGRVAQAQIVK